MLHPCLLLATTQPKSCLLFQVHLLPSSELDLSICIVSAAQICCFFIDQYVSVTLCGHLSQCKLQSRARIQAYSSCKLLIPCAWNTLASHAAPTQCNVAQAADLQQACAIARQDPTSDLAPTQTDFRERVHSLAAHLLQVKSSSSSLGCLSILMANLMLLVHLCIALQMAKSYSFGASVPFNPIHDIQKADYVSSTASGCGLHLAVNSTLSLTCQSESMHSLAKS